MREVLFFIASLAGAAVMTALAIIIRPESPFWKIFLWGGIGIFIACAAALALDYFRPGIPPFLLGGAALGLAVFVGFTAAIFLVDTAPRSESAPEDVKAPALFLQCTAVTAPTVMPASGQIWTLQMQTDGAAGGSLGFHGGPPGLEIGGPLFRSGYRCEVTNYGAKPVANVEVAFDLIAYEAVPVENGFHSGGQSVHKQLHLTIPKIESGRDNPFSFYVFNMAKQFMELTFLDKVKLTIIGDTKIYDAVLQQTYLSRIHLDPRQ